MSNQLKLNAEKSHLLTLGTKERLNNLSISVSVKMDGVELKEDISKQELLLGCKISSDLKWIKQVDHLKLKLKKRLVGLSHLRHIAHFKTKKEMAGGIFQSVLSYCLPLFGGCERNKLKELQVLQNSAARIVCNAHWKTPRRVLLDKIGWLSVYQLVVFQTLTMVFSIRRNGEPEYLAKHLKDFGRRNRIRRSNTRLSLALHSFTFRGAKLWNDLPCDIRSCQRPSEFKKLAETWILKNIPKFVDELPT